MYSFTMKPVKFKLDWPKFYLTNTKEGCTCNIRTFCVHLILRYGNNSNGLKPSTQKNILKNILEIDLQNIALTGQVAIQVNISSVLPVKRWVL